MKFVLVMMAVMLSIAALQAQQPTTLTLGNAIDLAFQRNVSVIEARNTLRGQQSATQAAIGGLFPTVDANASFSRQQNWQSDPGGTTIINGVPVQVDNAFRAYNNYFSGISSRVILFDGFANTSSVKQAQANAVASEYSLSRAEQNAVYQANQLFVNVYRTYQLLKVNEDNLKRSQRQLERIVESNKVGTVALADVYRQQVQVGSDELAMIQAQNNFEKAKTDCLAFIGVDFTTEYAFDFNGIPADIDTAEFTAINSRYADFNSLVATAAARRPDYLANNENLSSAEASVTIARAGHLPTISASGSFGYSNAELSNLSDNRNLNLSLNFSLPIFHGFSTQSQIEQAEVRRQNVDEQLRQSRRQLVVDVRKAMLDLEASEKQVGVTQTSVESAEMDRKIAEEKYSLGAGTLLDLLIANANYTTTLSNKVNAVTGYVLAKKGVEFALGTITK